MVSQNVQFNSPFAYIGTRDTDLHAIVVSYPAVTAMLDFRGARLKPHAGVYLASTLQVAGLGGDVRDVKLQPEIRIYLPLARRLPLLCAAPWGCSLRATTAPRCSQMLSPRHPVQRVASHEFGTFKSCSCAASFRVDPAQTEVTFPTFELRLRRSWSLSAVVGDRGASALKLLWRRRY